MGRSRALSGTVCTRGGAAGALAAECGVDAGPSGQEPPKGDPGPLHLLLKADSGRWDPRARGGYAGRGPESLPPPPRARVAHLVLSKVIYEVKVLNEATSWSPDWLYAFY